DGIRDGHVTGVQTCALPILWPTFSPVIMVTGENVGHIAAEAIRKGATDYVVKFGDYLLTIPLVVEKNLTVARIKRENEQLAKQRSEERRVGKERRGGGGTRQ